MSPARIPEPHQDLPRPKGSPMILGPQQDEPRPNGKPMILRAKRAEQPNEVKPTQNLAPEQDEPAQKACLKRTQHQHFDTPEKKRRSSATAIPVAPRCNQQPQHPLRPLAKNKQTSRGAQDSQTRKIARPLDPDLTSGSRDHKKDPLFQFTRPLDPDLNFRFHGDDDAFHDVVQPTPKFLFLPANGPYPPPVPPPWHCVAKALLQAIWSNADHRKMTREDFLPRVRDNRCYTPLSDAKKDVARYN